MKHQSISMLAALPAALLFACAASARQAPQQPTTQPQPQTQSQQVPQTQPMPQTQSAPAVPTTTQNIQCGNGGNCYDNNATDRDTSGSNGMRGQSFDSLAGSKGYVTESEAQNNPWLSSHFQQCDRNRDGKLTRSEYRDCHRRNASGGQP